VEYVNFATPCIQGVPKFAKKFSSTLLSSHKIAGKNVLKKCIFFFVEDMDLFVTLVRN
jgi:hypothetical protein